MRERRRMGKWGGAGRKRPRLTKNASSSDEKKTADADADAADAERGLLEDDEFLVAEYDSGGEGGAGGRGGGVGGESSSDEENGVGKGKRGGMGEEEDWGDLGLRQVCFFVFCFLLSCEVFFSLPGNVFGNDGTKMPASYRFEYIEPSPPPPRATVVCFRSCAFDRAVKQMDLLLKESCWWLSPTVLCVNLSCERLVGWVGERTTWGGGTAGPPKNVKELGGGDSCGAVVIVSVACLALRRVASALLFTVVARLTALCKRNSSGRKQRSVCER